MLKKRKLQVLSMCLTGAILLCSCGTATNELGTEDSASKVDTQLETEESPIVMAETESDEVVTESEIVIETESETEVFNGYDNIVDAKAALIEYLDANYTEDKVAYTTDDYNDKTIVYSVYENNLITYVLNQYDDYAYEVDFIPYIVLYELSDGGYGFNFALQIIYISNSFLDYLYTSNDNIIILADDGTRYSYIITSSDNESEDSLYYSYMWATSLTTDDISSMYEIMQKDGLSLRINYQNNQNDYPTLDIGDDTKQDIINTIDLYYELCEVLQYDYTLQLK